MVKVKEAGRPDPQRLRWPARSYHLPGTTAAQNEVTAVKGPVRTSFVVLIAALGPSAVVAVRAQDTPPSLRAGALTSNIAIDGRLNEAAWDSAQSTEAFTQADPSEGAPPTARTLVRVLVDTRALVIGIVCEEPDPSGIVSFSVRRDADLNSEDHIRVVLGPFADGRSGYVFAVNPSGARYDGF